MRVVGIERPDGQLDVATLTSDGRAVVPFTNLDCFWRAPREWLLRAAAGASVATDSVTLRPPVRPDAQVFCVGLNYRDHVAEGSFSAQQLPAHPTLFARRPRSLNVDGASVTVPLDEDGLDWEGEVVAWVGQTLRDVSPAEALECVVGYSAFNDLTARRAQKLTSQWTLGKNTDGSGILGPLIPARFVGDLAAGLMLQTRVNGEIVQNASTRDMIHSVGATLSHISRTLTLQPGDLLATGTPAGVGYARKPPRLLQPGDVVEVEVERLGVIRTPIVHR